MGNFASRVSENREGAELGNLNGSSEDKSQANDVKMESVNDSGPIEDYVMSEASSLLNTKQGSRDGFEEEEEIDDDEDEENGFHVGDFVWVQEVNRHQWWPGKIYDPSDASDLALKQMQKGTLLVAYCWNETFAWCNPSQLKPFLENFGEFSKTSGSISFRRAVEEAVREIGEHVEHMLVRDEALVSPVAVNCGIKEGVPVAHVRREVLTSLVLEEPGIVLEGVKSLAMTACFSDLLEIEVLKRKISAFYRSKGRFSLAEYDDDRYIVGLEDREDEYALNFVSSSWQRSLRKCSGLDSKKMKSINEVCNVDRADIATTTGSNTLKRRVSDLKQAEEISSSSRKSKKNGIEKREESNDSNHLEENEMKDDSGIEITVDLSIPLASVCKRVKVDVSSSVERNNGSGETIVQTGKRERKKSKYLSPEYMTDFSWSGRKSKIDSESSQIRAAERISNNSAEKAMHFVGLGATTEEILDLIREAALSTQYSKDYQSSYDMIREFASIYRSFAYDHGSNHKVDNKNVSDEEEQQVVDEKEQSPTMVKKKNKREVEKQFSGVDLYIRSGVELFGSTLPSKDDLIGTYSKFGALDRERSCMFDNNSCARVSFLNESDGEEALDKSLAKCPFGTTSTVTFELKYPSSETPENPNEKKVAENRNGVMEIECVKKKLDEIRTLLDQSGGGELTKELKMKLEDESRNLLDKVREMSVRSA